MAVGLCHHLGVLLFSAVLSGVEKEVAASGWLLKQWLAALLLGAVNIEQTKLLDFEDLRRLLGRTLRSLFPQRNQLTELAAGTTATRLLNFNAQRVGAAQQRDFYFDPHTKHYTGMQPVLKGWCARIRWADKVLHSDFFHTAAGQPVYLECADNYQDMRERLAALLPRFRQALGLPAEAVVTCVMDRGIFSRAVFAKAVEAPDYHLITWEKNFKSGPWDPQKCSGQYALERTRNHAQDKRVYRFEYLDQDWAQNPRMRQLIVQATNPQGSTIQVGILTDDRQRAAAQIIYLMFHRWTQENDFKYLDEHFGINQITSYASVAYERLRDQLQQKQIKSGAYKAAEQKVAQLKSQLSKLLLSQHQHPRKSARRTERITALTQGLEQAQQDQAKTQKEVSRLEVLINPRSQRQQENRRRFGRFAARWPLLTQDMRQAWRQAAKSRKTRVRLGLCWDLPPHNFFVQVNVLLASRGEDPCDYPPGWPEVLQGRLPIAEFLALAIAQSAASPPAAEPRSASNPAAPAPTVLPGPAPLETG